MRARDRLRRNARLAAAARGHILGDFIPSDTRGKDVALATCTHPTCTAYVQVITHPRPYETQIAGPAVAIHCERRAS